MKKLIFTTVFFITTVITYAQPSYKIVEETLPYEHYATSFTTDLIGLNEGFVMYQWQKFVEKHEGATYLRHSESDNFQLESEHVKFPVVDDKEVTIYARFTPNHTEDGVDMTIWIKMKDGSYFSSKNNSKKIEKLKQWLLNFNQQIEDENIKLQLNLK